MRIAIESSCYFSNAQLWLFRAIWFFPYIFRIVRLKLIWGMQKKYYTVEDVDETPSLGPNASIKS